MKLIVLKKESFWKKLRAIQLFVQLANLGNFYTGCEQTNKSKSMINKEIGFLLPSFQLTFNVTVTDWTSGTYNIVDHFNF